MTHPTDGTLLTLMDGELPADDTDRLRAHVAECPPCGDRLEALEAQRRTLVGALRHLDVEPRPTEAKSALLKRSSAPSVRRRGRARPGAWWRSSLAKAAGLILAVAAVASAALPGSPVRAWLETLVTSDDGTVGPPERDDAASAPEERAIPPEVGVRLVEVAGGVRISVVGLAPGGEILVQLVDGRGSGVYAAEGARFQTGPGRVEASVPGSWVRIELARSQGNARVEVDGALYLRKIGDRLQLVGPEPDSAETQIRFRVPEDGR